MALLSAWISSSQPLQDPASTSRIDRLRPSRLRAALSTLAASSASAVSSADGGGSVSGLRVKPSNNVLRMSSPQRSCPEYEQLKDLLHSGKSATMLFSIAASNSGH